MPGDFLQLKYPLNIFASSDFLFQHVFRKRFFRYVSDELWLQKAWKIKTGGSIDFSHPTGFNEKLQWLKLYDHNPLYTVFADKVKVRDYIRKRGLKDILVPALGVWKNPNDIDFEKLPLRFVLKCNHNSGEGMVLCKDKRNLDIAEAKRGLKKALSYNYFHHYREWAYKNIKPLIIGEKYIDHNEKEGLIDYKFYCFNGKPKFLYLGRTLFKNGVKVQDLMTFLGIDYKPVPFSRPDHSALSYIPPKPSCFDDMLKIAECLSEGIPFVRVDLYWVHEHIYFSELTLYPGAGYGFFKPDSAEKEIGDMLILPDKRFDK